MQWAQDMFPFDFLSLTLLEVVLGIDNVVFLSLLVARLPKARQPMARLAGLALALILRVVFLASIVTMETLTGELFRFYNMAFSWRDLILGAGGLFLLYKGTTEIHNTVAHEKVQLPARFSSFGMAIVQIALLDLVFSFDSIFTAVGMTQHLGVMIAAIAVAIAIMFFASKIAAQFIQKYLSIKMLALSFLLLVGLSLVADALQFHIPRQYLYFAILFSLSVESLTLWARFRRESHN
jgi:predicted tellurium resistance membrane protein TerC